MSTPSVHELSPHPSEATLLTWVNRGWLTPAQALRLIRG